MAEVVKIVPRLSLLVPLRSMTHEELRVYRNRHQKAYRERHKDRLKARYLATYDTDKNTDKQLRQMYGIDLTTYDQMYSDQAGRCAICYNERPPRGKSRLHVDHDHESGKVRALLCTQCNVGIGMLKTDPSVLDAARNYLLKHGRTDTRIPSYGTMEISVTPSAFITQFGGNPSRYGVGKTTGGGAPTPRSATTEGTDSKPVPMSTEPGYMGSSPSITTSRDSGPA